MVTINEPGKTKLIEDFLREIEGVEVEPMPAATGKGAGKKTLTASEQRFMEELRQAMAEVKAHLAGKKTLPLAKDLLHEL